MKAGIAVVLLSWCGGMGLAHLIFPHSGGAMMLGLLGAIMLGYAADREVDERINEARDAPPIVHENEHEHVEDCQPLDYLGHVGAPAYGIEYQCPRCLRPWLKVGDEYVDPRVRVYERSPEGLRM
jgi:hypothetical protein